jgi:PmbA protein
LVDYAIAHAKKLGATDVGAEASEGCGLSVSVRKGELENVERNRDKSLGVTVYLGNRRGNASTSDFSEEALERTVQAAYDIARFTAEDPVAGLPDEKDIAKTQPDLDLFHPWLITSEQAAQIALRCEAAALQADKRITNSEGAGVSAQQSHFFSAHTHGFRGGYASSRHSMSVAPIAGKGDGMQRDAWYSSMRSADELSSPEEVGRFAAERALSRLKSRKIATVQCPVLFDAPVAAGLLGGFVQAVSGGSLYRKSTFLLDSLGKTVFPKHLVMQSRLTKNSDDLDAMLRRLGTGLFVIELMGQGVNYVTGDYSRGASGFWVEKGRIAFPVHEITIAGNLKDMFQGIQAIGADAYTTGAKTIGSVLVNRMQVAGS